MKRMLIIAGIILGFIATVYCSYKFGYADCYYTTQNFECCNFKQGIETRTEGYEPDCAEIRNKGIPVIVKKDNDYFFVHSSHDLFYVFGINIEPGKPPQSYWRGGGFEEVIKNCTEQ